MSTAARLRPSLRVISHEATRTGAPRVLVDLLRLVHADLESPLDVQLPVGGPLEAELAALSDRASGPPCAVLVNSSLAADLVRCTPGVPAALYVHEDREGLAVLTPSAKEAIATLFDHVLCVSDRARDDLLALGVPLERLELLPPLVAPLEPPSDAAVAAARSACGAHDPDAILVLSCGEGSWRKGADLFVALAAALADDDRFRFAWIGLRPRSFARLLDHDVAAADLGQRLRWMDEVADTRPLLAAADVLAMTSRNDPQPLVPIEAALLGTPTVGFAIGGLDDLDAAGAARTVPFPDVAALAEAVREVTADLDQRAALVAAAVERWRQRQSPDAVRRSFLRVLSSLGVAVREEALA